VTVFISDQQKARSSESPGPMNLFHGQTGSFRGLEYIPWLLNSGTPGEMEKASCVYGYTVCILVYAMSLGWPAAVLSLWR
jgi:hypothetical protein